MPVDGTTPVQTDGGRGQLLRFAWVEAQCCLFAVLFLLGQASPLRKTI